MVGAILAAKVLLKKMVHKIICISANVQILFKKWQCWSCLSWKSKELSDETIKSPTTSNNSLAPVFSYYGTKTGAKFTRSCLKQDKFTYTHGKTVNIYIFHEFLTQRTIILL